MANGSFDSLEHHNYLYHNNGNGTFTKVTTGNIVTDSGSAVTAAWEDFDNDGCLDLFVSYNTGVGRSNALYHNNGDGTFTSATNIAPFKFRPACHRCLRLRAEKLKCHRPGIAKVGLLRIEVEYGAGQETGVLRLISDLVSSPKANTQGAG